jgi:hypothetical protein
MTESKASLKIVFERRPVLWSLFAGIFLGVLLLIPYLTLTYSLFWFIETGELGIYGPVSVEGPRVFRFFMLSLFILCIFWLFYWIHLWQMVCSHTTAHERTASA